MKRFVEGMDRGQSTLFPECLEDWICEDNPVRVIDAFVEAPSAFSESSVKPSFLRTTPAKKLFDVFAALSLSTGIHS